MIRKRLPIGDASPAARRRTGTTLLEMVATMSVLLLLAVSAVRMLSAVTDIGTTTADQNRGRRSIERLAKSIRQDFASLTPTQTLTWPLEIAGEEQRITYAYDQNSQAIVRTVFDESKPIETDRFTLPADCVPDFEREPELTRLVLKRGPSISWSIEVPQS